MLYILSSLCIIHVSATYSLELTFVIFFCLVPEFYCLVGSPLLLFELTPNLMLPLLHPLFFHLPTILFWCADQVKKIFFSSPSHVGLTPLFLTHSSEKYFSGEFSSPKGLF